MTFTNYAVFQDENRHSCIFISEERKYTYFIPMEALEVRVRQLDNREFARDYTPLTSYPVRRAAEIYLRAPDKAMTPEARKHLEAILSDPAHAYDAAAFPQLNILTTAKGKSTMARKSAAQVAEEVAVTKPRTRKEALQEADAAIAAQAPHHTKAPKEKPAAKAEAPAAKKAAGKPKAEAKEEGEAAPRGRVPTISGDVRLKVGNRDTVKRGFMLEFIDCAAGLEKGTRGKGFTVDSLLEAASSLPGAEGRDVGWIRTYVTYALDASRGILVAA